MSSSVTSSERLLCSDCAGVSALQLQLPFNHASACIFFTHPLYGSDSLIWYKRSGQGLANGSSTITLGYER